MKDFNLFVPGVSWYLVPRVFVLALVVTGMTRALSGAAAGFLNFETAPVHPVDLSPDGRTLAVCNLPDARAELFDVSSGLPISSGSVSVGLDPVTARFASANELWVVNFISSSISIIDVRTLTVVATLETPAGPSDLVFAGQPRRAWVSCSRTNAVFVIDPSTRVAVTSIAIEGERPRAMAVSPDRAKVYVAIFESGNGTTVVGRRLTPLNNAPEPGPLEDPRGPYRGVDPPPNDGTTFNPPIALPGPAPRVSQIVRKNAAGRWLDDNHGDWTEWVSGTNAALSGRVRGWDLPDRDVAIIGTVTLEVSYAHRLMNLCMAIAVNPVTGEISVVGTEATNERRFEPVLRGVFPLSPGNAAAGSNAFLINCENCHTRNSGRSGADIGLNFSARNGTQGAFLISQLRSLADKVGMDGLSTNSRAGFGFMHDGRVTSLTQFLVDGFPGAFNNDQNIADMVAFLLCFTGSDANPAAAPSQDVAASVGRQVTLTSPTSAPLLNSMIGLASRGDSRLELIVYGNQEGHTRSWLFQRFTQTFRPDHHDEPRVGLNDLLAVAAPGNELTAMLVPQGSGVRLALDRDGDGYFNRSEMELGFDPTDPESHPGTLHISKREDEVMLSWPSAPGVRYLVQWSPGFRTPSGFYTRWNSVNPSLLASNAITSFTQIVALEETQRLYRVLILP